MIGPVCNHTYATGGGCRAVGTVGGFCASHWRAHTLDTQATDLRSGDAIIELKRDGRTFGPGGFSDAWLVAEVEHRTGITLVTYPDGSQSALPDNTEAQIIRA